MKPVKIYAEVLEDSALEQFNSAMNQKFVISGALMADAHTGYSLPIGAVVATKNVVVPAWVGYDIGCGMCALKLNDVSIESIKNNSEPIFSQIYKQIPVSFNINKIPTAFSLDGLTDKGKEIAKNKKYEYVLGSLGGGNHFIEIGYDNENSVWVVIHSGSRGVGHGIAAHYMTLASNNSDILKNKFEKEFDTKSMELKKYNPQKYDQLKSKYVIKKCNKQRPREGHYGFDVTSPEGNDYIQDLSWCLNYALENRKEMMTRVVDVINKTLNVTHDIDFSKLINRNHNHAVERDGVWIHRKGATHAENGMLGVIPGNMKDGSFIVRGKGNAESLYSSSHGAGRIMSRNKAKNKLRLNDFKSSMLGITALVEYRTLDESPLAYKNIHDVMNLQKDLVDVVTHIHPVINIKG